MTSALETGLNVEHFEYKAPPTVALLHDKTSQLLELHGVKKNVITPGGRTIARRSVFLPIAMSTEDRLPSMVLSLASANPVDELSLTPSRIFIKVLENIQDAGESSRGHEQIEIQGSNGVLRKKPYKLKERIEFYALNQEMRVMRMYKDTHGYFPNRDMFPEELRKLDTLLDFAGEFINQARTIVRNQPTPSEYS